MLVDHLFHTRTVASSPVAVISHCRGQEEGSILIVRKDFAGHSTLKISVHLDLT